MTFGHVGEVASPLLRSGPAILPLTFRFLKKALSLLRSSLAILLLILQGIRA